MELLSGSPCLALKGHLVQKTLLLPCHNSVALCNLLYLFLLLCQIFTKYDILSLFLLLFFHLSFITYIQSKIALFSNCFLYRRFVIVHLHIGNYISKYLCLFLAYPSVVCIHGLGDVHYLNEIHNG